MAYAGGKGRAYQRIIALMPPHRTYIETHLGGGAVLRHKRPASQNVGIDIDPGAIAAWRKLRRPDVDLVVGDCCDLIHDMSTPDTLIYADPPYWPAMRRRARCYRHDYTENDHRRLIDTITKLNCLVMISGYRNDLYDEHLAGWHRHDMALATQSGTVSESIWMNFSPTDELHDYRFAGADFREREAIRRRIDSQLARLARTPAVELRATLTAVADAFPEDFRAIAARLAE